MRRTGLAATRINSAPTSGFPTPATSPKRAVHPRRNPVRVRDVRGRGGFPRQLSSARPCGEDKPFPAQSAYTAARDRHHAVRGTGGRPVLRSRVVNHEIEKAAQRTPGEGDTVHRWITESFRVARVLGWLHSRPMRSMNHSRRRRADENHPIFIASSGRRRRLVRYAAVTVGCACTGYMALFVAVFGGVQDPVGDQPPRMDKPLPSSSPQDDSDVPAGAHFPARSASPHNSSSPHDPSASTRPDRKTTPPTPYSRRDPAPTTPTPANASARPGGATR